MICINREEILAAMSPDMAVAEKQRIFRSYLDQQLPKRSATMIEEEAAFSAEDIANAIEKAISCTYDIEALTLTEGEDLANNMFCNDKALSMTINEDIIHDLTYFGEVFGRYNEETGCYHGVFHNPNFAQTHPTLSHTSVGLIIPADMYWRIMENDISFMGYDWFGSYVDGNWFFHKTDERYSTITVTEEFSFVATTFSRNAGLLETDIMQNKTIVLAGVGSVGSFAAMMMAKAGANKFILVDGDTLEIHNISRHWLGWRHLGEYKVDAMAEEIKDVNPFAQITTYRGFIQDAPRELFFDVKPEEGIVIASGDNRMCAAQANNLAQMLGLPFVAIGCWERAAVGENFYWHKDLGLPTYAEAFDGLISDDRGDGAHRAYFGTQEDAKKLRFEPGIYTDILSVTLVGVKLAQDLLNLKEDRYTTRVFDRLTNYTLVANTNKKELGGERAMLFPAPLFITDRSHGIWLKEKGDAACLTISL